jgi:hypothetical protein
LINDYLANTKETANVSDQTIHLLFSANRWEAAKSIEEKLNALGIYKIEQIAKLTSELEDEVNIAIEFFPGRVKRDEWVNQAKELSK